MGGEVEAVAHNMSKMVIGYALRIVGRDTIHQQLSKGRLDLIRAKLKQDPSLVNSRNKRQNTLLHLSIGKRMEDFSRELVVKWKADVNLKNNAERTSLMIAASSLQRMVPFLLEHGAMKSVTWTSCNMNDAADYARQAGDEETATLLTRNAEVVRQQERAAMDDELRNDKWHERCPVCDRRVKIRDKLFHLRQRFEAGLVENPLVISFMSDPVVEKLAQRPFHTLTHMKKFTKELTEAMACVEVVNEIMQSQNLPNVHVIDLCSGKSLTAAILMLQHPDSVVTPIDRLHSKSMPHYEAFPNVHYMQSDILLPGFPEELATRINTVGLPTIIIGMHLCGKLSNCAIDFADVSPLVRSVLLIPCCRPEKRFAMHYPPEVANSTDYDVWVKYLESEMITRSGNCRSTRNKHIDSPKNAMLVMNTQRT